MPGQMLDAQRHHRSQTSKAMKGMISTCPHCHRRGNYRKIWMADALMNVWVCHYCKGDWTAGGRAQADHA